MAGWHLVHLTEMQHLTEINLQTLDYLHLRGIFDGLATFKRLQRISLHAYRPEDERQDGEQDYEQSLIDLARQLPNLHEFSIKSIAIRGVTLMEFVRFAIKLKILHVHSCLTISNDLIMGVVTNLGLLRTLLPIEPLKMFINPADLVGLTARHSETAKKSLQMDVKCHHNGF